MKLKSTLRDWTRSTTASVPTGIEALDKLLPLGGVPLGAMTEIDGPESTGKSTLAMHLIRQAQALYLPVALIQAEDALLAEYVSAIGVDLDDVIVIEPAFLEQALDDIEELLKNDVRLVVLDSVAALAPRVETEIDFGDNNLYVLPRLWDEAQRRFSPLLRQSQAALVLINQERNQPGILFGNPLRPIAWDVLRYWASLRLYLQRIKAVRRNGSIVGNVMRIAVKKNRLGVPFRKVELPLFFGKGFIEVEERIDAKIGQVVS